MADFGIAKRCKRERELSVRALSNQYRNNNKANAFYNNDINAFEDYVQFEDDRGTKRRALVNFGRVQENVDAVVGFAAQNRRQAKFTAHLNASDQQQLYSKNMNALYVFHRENENADQVESEQDFDVAICGYGATDSDVTYITGKATSTPNGEIAKRKLNVDQVYWDAKCKNKNLIGSRWAGYWNDYDLKDALSLFQKSSKDDFEATPVIDDDSGFKFNPWGGLYDRIRVLDSVDWSDKEEDLVRVYNHQWFEYETFYKADNPVYLVDDPLDAIYIQMRLNELFEAVKNGGPDDIIVKDLFDFDPSSQIIYFDESLKSKLTAELKEMGLEDLLRPISFVRKCYYTAVVSGDHVFSTFKSIHQDGYTIQFKTGKYDQTHKMFVGIVNPMMEPTEYHSKALTELLFALAANSKGGVVIEEDAVEDITEFSAQYAKTDGVAIVRSGALAGGKFQPKAVASVPTGLDMILQLADQAISSNGVPAVFNGNVEREDQSGIFFKRRIRQVISKLAWLFDAITLYQKEDAGLHEDLIRVWIQNNQGAMVQIAGAEGADEFVQITEDMIAAKYSVSIQESSQTPEDKQETAQALAVQGNTLLQFNPSAGQQFIAESLQLLPLDGDVRNRLIKTLQPSDMVPAAQMQQIQQQNQILQEQIKELTNARIQAEAGKIASETALNQARLQSENAKTAKTLEDAANVGLENDIVRAGGYSDAKVSI